MSAALVASRQTAPGLRGAPPAGRWIRYAWIALVSAACLLRLLWIGDVPFIVDEPRLMAHALQLNAEGRWAVHGISGSRLVHYGPLPAWIYQVALPAADNPMQIVWWKTCVVTAVTAGALFVWGRLLPRGTAALLWVALLAPYYWKQSRDLWDISWTVPLGLAAWAGYLAFDARPSRGRLAVVLAGLTGLLLTHLVSVPVIAAIGLHLVWRHHAWLWSRRVSILAIGALCLAVASPYLRYLTHAGEALADPQASWSNAFGGLLMFQPYTVFSIEGGMGEAWWRYPGFPAAVSVLFNTMRWATLLAAVLFALGIWAAARGRGKRAPVGNRTVATADAVALLAFGLWVPLAVFKGLTGFSPNYFNPFAGVLLHFLWRGAGAMTGTWERRPVRAAVGRGVIATWALSLCVCLGAIHWRVHDGQGTRGSAWGPTLANQWALAQEIARLPNAPRLVRPERPPHVPDALDLVPFPLEALRRFASAGRQPAIEPLPEVEVDYRWPADPWNGAITVHMLRETHPGE